MVSSLREISQKILSRLPSEGIYIGVAICSLNWDIYYIDDAFPKKIIEENKNIVDSRLKDYEYGYIIPKPRSLGYVVWKFKDFYVCLYTLGKVGILLLFEQIKDMFENEIREAIKEEITKRKEKVKVSEKPSVPPEILRKAVPKPVTILSKKTTTPQIPETKPSVTAELIRKATPAPVPSTTSIPQQTPKYGQTVAEQTQGLQKLELPSVSEILGDLLKSTEFGELAEQKPKQPEKEATPKGMSLKSVAKKIEEVPKGVTGVGPQIGVISNPLELFSRVKIRTESRPAPRIEKRALGPEIRRVMRRLEATVAPEKARVEVTRPKKIVSYPLAKKDIVEKARFMGLISDSDSERIIDLCDGKTSTKTMSKILGLPEEYIKRKLQILHKSGLVKFVEREEEE